MRAHHHETGQAVVDLVLFEVAGRCFGADALDVARVAHRSDNLPTAIQLGESSFARVLVVRSACGDVQVPIDRFVGIHSAPLRALRAVPSVARGIVEPALVGFLLQAQEIVLLIDLQALVNEGNLGETAGGREAALR